MRIAVKFYTDLYNPNKVNKNTQDRLLRNIKNKISQEEKEKLDAPVSESETKTAVFQMGKGKTPGPDGIPVEFYQIFWEEIKCFYIPFLRAVNDASFPKEKNTSIIKIIHKKTG